VNQPTKQQVPTDALATEPVSERTASWWMFYRLLLAVLFLGVANFWGCSSPNGFLKCANFIRTDALPRPEGPEGVKAANPAALIAPIPYDEFEESPWVIEPDVRVHLVFELGLGNCAYMSRGLGRVLQKEGVPYTVVWIMDREQTRAGVGHTVVECPIQLGETTTIGLIDMLEGGVPEVDGRAINVTDLIRHSSMPEARIRSFNAHKDERSVYYGPLLEDSVIGVTTGEDMNRYFEFLKLTYFDVGYPRIEKLIYNVGGMVLGVFPPVYITPSEAKRFDSWFVFEIAIARTMIWTTRILLVMLVFDGCLWTGRWLWRKLRTSKLKALQSA
jgi:hypothetical protein